MIVISLFLNVCQISGSCSYKIVLIKKEECRCSITQNVQENVSKTVLFSEKLTKAQDESLQIY